MIVLDTSAAVTALVGRDAPMELLDLLAGEIHAPHLLDIEVLSALRGLARSGHVALSQVDRARDLFAQLTIHRHEAAPLAERIWELRHQYTAYDAAYIALAEALGAELVTSDAKLDSGGHQSRVRVLRGGS